MYMPGRRRTGSSPSRTWISLAVYLPPPPAPAPLLRVAIAPLTALLQGERQLGQKHLDDAVLLGERVPFAAARAGLVALRAHLDALALVGLDGEPLAQAKAEHPVALGCLEDGHAAPR